MKKMVAGITMRQGFPNILRNDEIEKSFWTNFKIVRLRFYASSSDATQNEKDQPYCGEHGLYKWHIWHVIASNLIAPMRWRLANVAQQFYQMSSVPYFSATFCEACDVIWLRSYDCCWIGRIKIEFGNYNAISIKMINERVEVEHNA